VRACQGRSVQARGQGRVRGAPACPCEWPRAPAALSPTRLPQHSPLLTRAHCSSVSATNRRSRAPGWSRPSPSQPHACSVAADAHITNLIPSSSVNSVSLPAREPSSKKLRSRGPSRRQTSMKPSSWRWWGGGMGIGASGGEGLAAGAARRAPGRKRAAAAAPSCQLQAEAAPQPKPPPPRTCASVNIVYDTSSKHSASQPGVHSPVRVSACQKRCSRSTLASSSGPLRGGRVGRCGKGLSGGPLAERRGCAARRPRPVAFLVRCRPPNPSAWPHFPPPPSRAHLYLDTMSTISPISVRARRSCSSCGGGGRVVRAAREPSGGAAQRPGARAVQQLASPLRARRRCLALRAQARPWSRPPTPQPRARALTSFSSLAFFSSASVAPTTALRGGGSSGEGG
jgi:hypothetical protein